MKRIFVPLRRRFRGSGPAQILLIVALWLAAEALVRVLALPVPAGILGMAALLLLLATRRVSPRLLARGAEWLLAEMLLFFVPAAMILLDNRQMLGWLGLKLLVVVACGTLLVMGTTALTVELLYRREARRDA